jgi:hypothetical protein
MPSTWRQDRLPALVTTLAARPGHEVRMPEMRGRADMLFGLSCQQKDKPLPRNRRTRRRLHKLS